ncbi:hypothetical protein, partial [Streptomyces sp. NPDC020141]|uniref:hypothetical protein n=1 Tax=Streptomyces sp. NPDC020141 TaxID=3365065 RepID=UPI0037B617F2
MAFSVVTRIHLMATFLLVAWGAVGGTVFGQFWGGRTAAWVAGGVAGPGAGIGSWLSRRRMTAFFQPTPSPGALAARHADGYAEGITDGVLAAVVVYQAAVFPLTPDGVTDEERMLRRTLAYRFAAFDGLPRPVRVAAAEALEALDQGLDADRARAAMTALSL